MPVNPEMDAGVDEQRLAAGVQAANVPTLLLLLVQMTGDTKWLDGPYLPSRSRGIEDNDTGGLPDEIQEEIREAALNMIVEWRHGKPFRDLQTNDGIDRANDDRIHGRSGAVGICGNDC